MLIGITGPIGHGKTVLGEALVAASGNGQRLESSQVIMEVANALRALPIEHPASTDLEGINAWLEHLKPIVHERMHVDVPNTSFTITKQQLAANIPLYEKLFEYLAFIETWPKFATAEITVENKHRYRSLLQWIGGYCVITIHPTIWWDELIRRAENQPEITLTVLSGMRFPAEAERVREKGGTIIGVERPSVEVADKSDVTERDRNNIAYDLIVQNDGTLEQLARLAAKLYTDLEVGSPKSQYKASLFT